jgi:TonB family protein
MNLFTTRDNRRMAQSTLVSLVIHIVLFVALSIFIAVNGVKSQDRLGTLTLNLESSSRPARQTAPDKLKEEEKAPQPSPSVKPKPPEPVKPSPRPVVKTKPAETRTATAKTTNAMRTAKNTNAPIKDPAPATTPVPKSNLETGSLSQLDAMLKESETKKTTTTNSSGGSGGGGSSGNSPATTRWDDNAVRQLISQAAPVIPKWVSEQGLRLKVELSVELNADGLVIVRGVRVSTGYPDVDAAVAKAVSRWKYTRGTGAQNVKGVITYFITPR